MTAEELRLLRGLVTLWRERFGFPFPRNDGERREWLLQATREIVRLGRLAQAATASGAGEIDLALTELAALAPNPIPNQRRLEVLLRDLASLLATETIMVVP